MKKGMVQDIADSLGISRVTVWKVMNQKPGVSDEMRRKVLARASDLQLAGDTSPSAMPLRQGGGNSNDNVALVVNRPESSIFWMKIINQIAIELNRCHKNLIYVYLNGPDFEGNELPPALMNGQMTGMLVLNVYDVEVLGRLSQTPIPKVFLDCSTESDLCHLEGDVVLLDGRDCVQNITSEIIRRGRKRLAFIGDISYARSNYTRWEGFQAALREFGIPEEPSLYLTRRLGVDTYPQEIGEFLEGLKEFPNAIVCASDYIGYIVVDWLAKKGKRVPEDVAVSGYDDNREVRISDSLLTTVHVQNSTLGKRLVRQLMFRMENRKADTEVVHVYSQIRWKQSTDF